MRVLERQDLITEEIREVDGFSIYGLTCNVLDGDGLGCLYVVITKVINILENNVNHKDAVVIYEIGNWD